MRRFTFLLVLLIVSAGCNAEGPVDPASAAPSGISRSVQNDSTSSDPTGTTTATGIGVGSGSGSDSASDGGLGIGSGT